MNSTSSKSENSSPNPLGPFSISTFLSLHGQLTFKDFERLTKGPFLLLQRKSAEPWLFDLGAAHKEILSIVLGRDPQCHIVFDGDAVSRQHAAFEFRDDQCFIRDLGASNGTFVNKTRLDAHAVLALTDQAPIHFGPSSRGLFLSCPSLFAMISRRDPEKSLHDLSDTAKKLSKFILTKSNLHLGPFDLGSFAQKVAKLNKDEFLAAFPCPALIRLQSTIEGQLLAREEETAENPIKRQERGFRRAKFWYLKEEGDAKPFYIGRDAVHNDLVVDEADISRHHAILTYEDERWFVSDQESTTGTRLNGHPLEGRDLLVDESFISLGGICVLQFVSAENFYEFLRRYNLSAKS